MRDIFFRAVAHGIAVPGILLLTSRALESLKLWALSGFRSFAVTYWRSHVWHLTDIEADAEHVCSQG
jgi:hypothetical protein